VFVVLAAVVVALDQLSKAIVVGALAPGQSTSVLDDLLRVVHGQNNGGLFGLFRGQAPIFAVVSIAVIVLIVAYEARAGRSLLVSIALGLLLGGALGNLADRMRIGHVVDFVDAGIGGLRFFTFNIADSAISLSILLLILLAIRSEPKETERTATGRRRPGGDDGGTAAGVPVRVGPGGNDDTLNAGAEAQPPDLAEHR
jgi:signal peptidase II